MATERKTDTPEFNFQAAKMIAKQRVSHRSRQKTWCARQATAGSQ